MIDETDRDIAKRDVTIIGAGMAGCLMAILLAKDNFAVEVYESGSDVTKQPIISGRSINQSLGAKGVSALKEAGLWEAVRKIALPQTGRIIHLKNGEELYEPYGQKHKFIEWTVNRNELNKTLLDEIKKYPSIRVTFDCEAADVDLEKCELTLNYKKTGQQVHKKTATIIGADGINSRVRQALEEAGQTVAKIDELKWGYKNILIKKNGEQALPFRNDAFHCWPCKKSSMVGMANREFFTCTLILPLSGEGGFEGLRTKNALLQYLRTNCPELCPYIDSFADDFIARQPTIFRTLHTSRWHYRDRVALIGDAAHAMTIFYGQGVNAAFDDCVLLARLIKAHSPDIEKAFAQFQSIRQEDTEAIANLCLQRLVALKDKYSSPFFLAKTNIEMALEKLLPDIWLSEYTLIVHTQLPYADGLKRYNLQRNIAHLFGMDIAVFIYGSSLLARNGIKTLILGLLNVRRSRAATAYKHQDR